MAAETENYLANEKSPYLKSAAHQPVRWYAWSPEPFQIALELDRPILLDIGAVWCHWCHVIDRESYENPEIARLLNDFFIAIKVDRDERPDIDARYQLAVNAVSGQGGWPLTAFLTPDGNVFYGGTYFPPEDRHGRPGLKTLLPRIAQIYKEKRAAIQEDADNLHRALKENLENQAAASSIPEHLVESVLESMQNQFDRERGGFGTAPKFPHTGAMELAINRLALTGDKNLSDMIEITLSRMGKGGVYDQLGGGFHRYSTDAEWIVPHFEKMLYDNSELLKNYVHAYQLTGNSFFREIAEGILTFTNRDLSDQAQGGFYTSQDADIDLDDDGDYFTWTKEETEAALTPKEAEAACLYYGIEERGEMHHNSAKNVLYAVENATAPADLSSIKSKMLEARTKRQTPAIDRTVYSSWNGMMILAYLEAYKGLGDIQARDFALKSLDCLLKNAFDEDHGFYHAYSDGSARIQGFLDDQMQMARALLSAYEITGKAPYLEYAEKVTEISIRRFWDSSSGGFFDIALPENAVGKLSIRQKSIQDSPTPSANAAAGMVLEKLYFLTGRKEYLDKAEATLKALAPQAERLGFFAATYAVALDFHHPGPLKIVIAGGDKDAREALRETALKTFHPHKVVKVISPEEANTSYIDPAVRTIAAGANDTKTAQAYVCQAETCQSPVSDTGRLEELIRGKIRYTR